MRSNFFSSADFAQRLDSIQARIHAKKYAEKLEFIFILVLVGTMIGLGTALFCSFYFVTPEIEPVDASMSPSQQEELIHYHWILFHPEDA